MMFASRQSVGCRFPCLCGKSCPCTRGRDYVEAAFINGSWSWPWERTASASGVWAGESIRLCHDARGLRMRHYAQGPWVPPHCLLGGWPEGHWLSWKSACPRGVEWESCYMLASAPFGACQWPRDSEVLVHSNFPSLLMLLGRCILDHIVSLLAAGPLSCLILTHSVTQIILSIQLAKWERGHLTLTLWFPQQQWNGGLRTQNPQLSDKTLSSVHRSTLLPKIPRGISGWRISWDLACSLSQAIQCPSNDICHLCNTNARHCAGWFFQGDCTCNDMISQQLLILLSEEGNRDSERLTWFALLTATLSLKALASVRLHSYPIQIPCFLFVCAVSMQFPQILVQNTN